MKLFQGISVRNKALIVSAIVFVIFPLIISFTYKSILLDGFVRLEQENMKRNLERSSNIVAERIQSLNAKSADWARWDDSYRFIQERNDDFIRSNITPSLFTDLALNFVVFLNTSGDVVFSQGMDLEKNTLLDVPASLLSYLKPGSALLTHASATSSLSGILMLPESPMLVSSRPITPSSGEGPARGTLIFARYMTGRETAELARIVNLNLAIVRMDSEEARPYGGIVSRLASSPKGITQPVNNNSINGYIVLKDIFGNPALLLKVSAARGIFQQGLFTVGYLSIILLFACMLVGGIVFLMFRDELAQQVRNQQRLKKINECFLNFGADPSENINRLTALCGEFLNADCALYNRLDNGMLCTLGKWKVPPDFPPEDKAQGHICTDIIKEGSNTARLIRNLPKTPYAVSDPNVLRYKLQTYVGKAVKFGSKHIGSLCVVYGRDYVPAPDQLDSLNLISFAIGIEEMRRSIEAELKEAKNRATLLLSETQRIMEKMPVGLVIIGKDKKIRQANKAALLMMGAAAESEVVGRVCHKFLCSADHGRCPVLDLHGAVDTSERILLGCSGSQIPVIKSVIPITIADEEVLLETFVDISERKRAEQKLQETEKRFMDAFHASPDAALLISEDGIEASNNAAVQSLRFGSQEDVPDQPWEFSPQYQPDGRLSRDKSQDMIKIALQKGINRFEWVHRRADGQDFPVEVTLSSVPLHGKQMVQAVWKDLSELKKNEEGIRKLTYAVEQSAGAVLITDLQGKIEYANPKYTEITGFPREEVIGKVAAILREGRLSVEEHKSLWDAILSGGQWRGEVLSLNKEDEAYWEYVLVSPIKNEKNVITHFLISLEDITQRKRAEVDLRLAKEEAEVANRAKSQFLANMSHEIRTPLNAVIGFSRLLEETSLDNQQKDYAATIRESGQVLLSLISDILDVSKIEAREIHLESIDFNLEQLVASVIKINATRLKDKDVAVVFKYEVPDEKVFKGDPTRIRQVVSNLVSNAIKFTERGTVVVTVSLVSQGENQLPEARRIRCSVKDTGIGIPQDMQETIFMAFTQADISTTRKFGGTGLGLTIAKALVEMMGGSIKVISEPGNGSEFVFDMQLLASTPEDRAQQARIEQLRAAAETASCIGLKVLVAEDNPVNQKLMELMLQKLGCQAEVAANGKIALEKIRQNRYDLVLMDLQMPEMGGVEAVAQIRREGRKDLPVIALTAAAMKEDEDMSLAAGMNDFIAKPIDAEKLAEKVRKWGGACS